MKPQLKHEMVVKKFPSHLSVYPASPDAIRWLEDNAPDYGSLMEAEENRIYVIYVLPNYDIDDVATYIESMGVTDLAVTKGD